jgi:DNA-binding transcriptional LysR family regulator
MALSPSVTYSTYEIIDCLLPDLLRSFVAVAQTKSFSRAAEREHLSQSTVSQQIRRLEDLVGKLLFERDTRTVTLTRDGEAPQSYAVRILDLMSEAVKQFRAPAFSGHVRLGLSEDFASAGLTAPMVGFLRRNPEVELTIEIGMSGDLFRRLDEGRYDLVFAKRRHGSRRGRVVRSEPLFWCAGARASNMKSADVVPLVLHPEPSVTRLRVLRALGLGVSAFARYVMPDGLTRITGPLPKLATLEFVLDTPKVISKSVVMPEATLVVAAR